MNGVRIGDYGHDIEFGVFITPAAESADEVVAWSELAEEAGYDLVTFNDHPYSAVRLDAWTLMSFVAARTSRVRLSRHVRSCVLVARWGGLGYRYRAFHQDASRLLVSRESARVGNLLVEHATDAPAYVSCANTAKPSM